MQTLLDERRGEEKGDKGERRGEKRRRSGERKRRKKRLTAKKL